MTTDAIFQPVLVMIALTFAVGLWMLALRIRAVREGRLPGAYFRLYRGGKEPPRLAQVTQHFHNLLEVPPLFYVSLLVIHAMGRVDDFYLALAWLYVLFRLLHTGVHTTYNDVLHRLAAFLASLVVLAVIWGRIGSQLLGH